MLEQEKTIPRSLEHLKILDLSDHIGAYCSKLFANLGADVTLIEPLEGNKTRRGGSFFQEEIDLEKNLNFHYLNGDKKSITLNLEQKQAQIILKKMLKETDVIIESFAPGYLKSIGINYEEIKKEFPHLVWCSITPFGQRGPYSNFKADDLILMSMGGMAYLAGYTDETPLVSFGEISTYSASLFSAYSIMIALHNRNHTQLGEFIDVSMVESVAMLTETAPQFFDLQGKIRKRLGDTQREPGMGIYPCINGYILFYAGEIGGGTGWVNLVQWLNDENIEGAVKLKDPKWRDKKWKSTEEAKEQFNAIIIKLTNKYTKDELYAEGQRRRIALGPVNNAKDTFENEQLKSRNFFVPISKIDNHEIMGPGAPYLMSETPWCVEKPAPTLGQDNKEILTSLGYSEKEVKIVAQMGVI